MNKGTKEGTEEEIKFVKMLNSDKNHKFWEDLVPNVSNHEDFYAIHVTGKKYGKINQEKIKPKADAYIAKGHVDESYLENKGYYLDENDVALFKLKKCDFTGISIKREDSSKYQILKISPDMFYKLFGSYELGAGASIFCKFPKDLLKNQNILVGWKTDWSKIEKYFDGIKDIEKLKDTNTSPEKRLKIADELKKYSNKTIKDKICKNKELSNFIFMGIGNFEEPYTAHWVFEHGVLKKAGPEPFIVTTGSGRTHGDFTVVIKPK